MNDSDVKTLQLAMYMASYLYTKKLISAFQHAAVKDAVVVLDPSHVFTGTFAEIQSLRASALSTLEEIHALYIAEVEKNGIELETWKP